MKTAPNNPHRAGELAGPRETFGPFSRFAVAPVHTRFQELSWFVWDAEKTAAEDGLPTVIGQCDSYQDALERVDAAQMAYVDELEKALK